MRAKVTLYGGVNEIGGNKFLLEEGELRLLLDFGTSIGARNAFYDDFLQPRTGSVLRDLLRLRLLPRIDGLYRRDMLEWARVTTDGELPRSAHELRARGERPAVDGILLTHAHVDHFQDLSFVDPEIPVYCTPTTARMLRAIEDVGRAKAQAEVVSVRERTLGVTREGDPKLVLKESPRRIVEVEELAEFPVGGARVTAIPVDHSVPGGCAFLVRLPSGKRVFYTGDVRFHGRLVERTAALLRAADGLEPDLMLSEGTRVDSAASDGEEDVERGVLEHVQAARGLVVVEFGWKDTTRFDTLQRVAQASGRTLVVDPRLAQLLHALDDRPDVPSRRIERYPNVRAYLGRARSMLDWEKDYPEHERGYVGGEADAHFRRGLRAHQIAAAPERYMVHLSFWSVSELFDLAPPAGSRWIRCATEPYNDDMASDLTKQQRWMRSFALEHNVTPRKGDDDPDLLHGTVHVSGHGGQADLYRLARAARPKLLVPVHTAEANLEHFSPLGFPLALFRGVGPHEAAAGECAVEF